MKALGPVSTYLEADLRSFVRRNGVVVWLDADRHYTELVDAMTEAPEALPYAVYAYRKSHMELMLALEGVASGVEKPQLMLHMPGYNEESIRDTPMLELYLAGKRYRRGLGRLVTDAAAGKVPPEEIEAFIAQEGLTLQAADAWLQARIEERSGGGLGATLQALSIPALVDDLLGGGSVAVRLADPGSLDIVWEVLAARIGLTPTWRASCEGGAAEVAFVMASWALAVEYVDDLERAPVDSRLAGLSGLPNGVVRTCREFAEHLRQRHERFYRQTADDTEGRLAAEVQAAQAEDLGEIDTFRFEEDKVLSAALKALGRGDWAQVRAWTTPRMEDGSFWLRAEPARRSTWDLLHDAMVLGNAIHEAGLGLEAKTMEQAMARYTGAGAAVDRAHRRLEQRRATRLEPHLPEFQALRHQLDKMRERWRRWADGWARDFSELCREQGFLPVPKLQQRTLFDEVVKPMTSTAGITAYFVVDALRYEMAEELFATMSATPATSVHLEPRLAELPTVTAVGMNALAPVAQNGRLKPRVVKGSIKGFSTGEFVVDRPKTRARAMWNAVGGSSCPLLDLDAVLNRNMTSLKQSVAQARLVVVHSDEIDKAGENGLGPSVFDTVMQKLKAAWRLLREAGVRRFVFTADHGFLLLGDSDSRSPIRHGSKIVPDRRHVISELGADHANEVRVPLSELGYEGVEGLHLMVPQTTACFDIGEKDTSFVHGGNSLQERVIPVLTVDHRSAAGGNTLRYEVRAEAGDSVMSMHSLKARVQVVAQASLAFGAPREVELGLRVVDEGSVNVELGEVQGGAKLKAGLVRAKVGEEFQLSFKLTAPGDARVRVELYHPTAVADVQPFALEARFAVASTGVRAPAADKPAVSDSSWLDELEGGVRQLFAHLQAHGAVTEQEANAILGSPRKGRKFAKQFEGYAAIAPFEVRIDVVGGIKRYVRVGSHE